ncbi:efflux RND transporter periplasmic adaptor subunit [Geochorda subterranea]|uniref:Efflux RND transporter periplasmic adaptor subunit n=1 Tax=Geochorda subterranea TaxID=3109564 RepID=A0ABZ1BS55_9FIRM|nr:efflux RND transporter periplasmic adaptor subunit [Limnochorda sp. LNt]WRP15301.1 efflux RND transporter periplasmic adaptor subunit [Limnochorda sp. LNt]
MAQRRVLGRALHWSVIAAVVLAAGGVGTWWWLAARRAEGSTAGSVRPPAGAAVRGEAEAVVQQEGRALLRLASQAGVQAVPVQRVDIRRYVEATGTITSERDVTLSFGVGGRLEAVHVGVGDRVQQGDLLAELDDTSLRLAYVRARNAYEQARLEQGSAQVEESRLAMEAARQDLEGARLVAPFDGVVVSVDAQAGEHVSASQAVVRLVDLSALRVEVSVDEVDLPYVRQGQAAVVTVRGYPDLALEGEVERLTPAGRSQGDLVLFDVVVRLREARDELLPGMTATARIEVARADGVLAVPEEAVVETGGRALVSRVVDGSIVLTPVELGVSDGRFVEVRSGLREGDRVLATNYEVYRRLAGSNPSSGGPPGGPGTTFRLDARPVGR